MYSGLSSKEASTTFIGTDDLALSLPSYGNRHNDGMILLFPRLPLISMHNCFPDFLGNLALASVNPSTLLPTF